MEQGGWSITAVFDVVASAVPDRPMVICGPVRRSFAEGRARTRGLAAFFGSRGVGAHRERADLEQWETGQDMVALLLHNGPEYLESMLGAYRARAVPFNVNQHYRAGEVAALLADVGAGAVVYHLRYGPLLAEAADRERWVLVHVDDGSGVAPLPGSVPFEEAVATPVRTLPEPSPDDLYAVCTGGTTGRPKAVLWRQADIYLAGLAGSPDATEASIAAAAVAGTAHPWFAVPPLMHAAAQWTAFSGLLTGAPVLLHDDSGPFDPQTILEAAERERAHLLSVVGDAHARPLVEELRRRHYDLSSLAIVGTGGAITTEPVKQALLELLPHVVVVDGYGSSESGTMAFGPRTAGPGTTGGSGVSFRPSPGVTVVSGDRTRELEPGEDEVGWTARRGTVPLGYLGDRDKTEATFPLIGGERMAVPGDRARRRADGSIDLLGRDAMVVNTGGEKVFVEEVETVLLAHPSVDDALVVGRPSERFGQEVVAVVSLRPGDPPDPAALREFVAARIARFKAPRAVLVCDRVQRHANGKADYRWARSVADQAVDATVAASARVDSDRAGSDRPGSDHAGSDPGGVG